MPADWECSGCRREIRGNFGEGWEPPRYSTAREVGGWIIEVHVDEEGTVTRCKGEFVPLYVALENDY